MKSILFKGVACGLAVISFVGLGCSKNEKKDEGVVSKVAGYVGDEIKAKFTGRVDEIAGWYLKYDHEGLRKAVSNPKSEESQVINKKVSGQMEYLQKEWIKKSNLKEIMEIMHPFDEKTAIAIKMKIDYDKKNGNDISKNFIPVNHRKWFAMQLSEELRTAVTRTCYDIQSGKSQDVIDRDWENVVEARERVTNYIDNKPVIYKQQNNTATTENMLNTRNNVTSSGSASNSNASAPHSVSKTPKKILLSVEEKKKLSVFFSNFAETWGENIPKFRFDGISNADLIQFGVSHNIINRKQVVKNINGKQVVPVGEVRFATMKYFGKDIQPQSIGNIEYDGTNFYTTRADRHADCSGHIREFFDNQDGTYTAIYISSLPSTDGHEYTATLTKSPTDVNRYVLKENH